MWTIIEQPQTIKGGDRVNVKWKYEGDKQIQTYHTSCSCITSTFNNNIMDITFDTQKVENESYITSKSVFITYDDTTVEILTFQKEVVR